MRRLLPLGVAVLVLGAWALAARSISPLLLPGPAAVVAAIAEHGPRLAEASWTTASSSLLGLLLASAFGLGGAALFLRSRWIEAALYPYALLLQTLPIVAIAPLLVVWLGYGRPGAVVTAAIVSFFPVLTAGNLGLRATDPAQVELFRLHRASWWQELRLLRVPAALPFLFAGYRTAVGLSVIGAIVGEFVGSNSLPPSLGNLVLRSAGSADTALTFAAVGASTLLALLLFGAVRGLERLTIGRWHGR